MSRRSLITVAVLGLLCVLAPLPGVASAAPTPWTSIAGRLPDASGGRSLTAAAARYRAYSLDRASLARMLTSAPTSSSGRPPATLPVPTPEGGIVDFAVVSSPVMQPKLAAAHPEIRTFAGRALDDPTVTGRFDLTPTGFHAFVRGSTSPSGWLVDPAYGAGSSTYVAYRSADAIAPATGLAEPDQIATRLAPRVAAAAVAPSGVVTRHTYRLALLSDPSYASYAAAQGTTVLDANVTLINRVDEIYNDDLGVRLELVNNEDALNLDTPTKFSNAGFSSGTQCDTTALSTNQHAIDSIIGSGNYDIGHLALGTDGGGLAYVGVVGNATYKARGCTGITTPTGDVYAVDYVAHEMGHQFGADHTFASNVGSCQGNGSTATDVEPGSGSSIMAYAGICGSDDLQPHSDPYFSQFSQAEIRSYIATAGAGGTPTTTSNHAPVVSAPASASIPLQTPFALTGSATDPDGDPLVFSWEQNDAGPLSSLSNQARTGGPLFRIFGTAASGTGSDLIYNNPAENAAGTSTSRVFPDLTQILAGDTNAETGTCASADLDCLSELLPTSAYTGNALHFRLTARDLNPAAGGTSYADVTLTPVPGTGPFLVTSRNTGTPAPAVAGASEPVTWNVAGTNTAALAQNVRISMSADGGLTFPYVLASSTPNTGSATITWPNVATTQARIKVEAVGNYFFDISNVDFTVQPQLLVDPAGTGYQAVQGGAVTGPSIGANSGRVPATGLSAVATGLPAGLSLAETVTSPSDPGAATWTVTGQTTAPVGVYPFHIVFGDGTDQVTRDLSIGVVAAASSPSPSPSSSPSPSPSSTPGPTPSSPSPASIGGTGTHGIVTIDDRQLSVTRGRWKRGASAKAFSRTFSTTHTKGAALSVTVSGASALSVLVGTGAGYGKLTVLLNGKPVKVIALRGRSGFRAVALPLSQLFTGTVTIVCASGRPVRVDGLRVVS